jgi:hypothetical protein
MSFKKTVEDFVCEHCGANVVGDGFTNHCSECLWSKHVDKHPGDRENNCGGMMEPAMIESKDSVERIIHQCVECGARKTNKTSNEDNRDTILRIINERANLGLH